MRIGLIVPGFSASEDDWCIPALLNSVEKLAQNHEVHVFTLRYPHHAQSYQVYSATVYPFNGQQRRGWTRLRVVGQCLHTIRRIHQTQPFDVLHALWVEEPALIATLAGRWLNIPAVLSLMGGELVGLPDIQYGYQRGRFMRRLIDFCLKRAPFITVGSEQLRQNVSTAYQTKTQRVPLGVDTRLFTLPLSNFAKHPSFTGNYNLVHVASLSPIKNQRMLLDAVALASKNLNGLQLHMVGTGTLEAELSDLATKLNLDVVWHGQVAHHALPLYYQSADLALLTSFFESQSMVALEAGACGTLTIGTAVGVLPELVDGRYLCKPDAPIKLAAAIEQLLTQPTLCQELADTSRRQILDAYCLDHQIEAWLSLYQQAIRQNTRKRLKSS